MAKSGTAPGLAPPLRIILPEDEDCPHTDVNGYCQCALRTGGDVLKGDVVLSACSFSNLDIFFEGELPAFLVHTLLHCSRCI